MTTAYHALVERFGRLGALQDSAEILGWDRETIMPSGGAEGRAGQLAALEVVCHGMLTDPVLAELLDRAEGEDGLGQSERANVGAMRRAWRNANAVPPDLVEALSRATSAAHRTWLKSRPASDFAAFLPVFKEVLNLTRQAAVAKAEAGHSTPYDALLDDYDPGLTQDRIDPLFDRLGAVLPAILDDVVARQTKPLPLDGRFPIESQRALGLKLMAVAGFDFERGRLDVSAHPFTGGTPDDVRITTRYDEDDFTSGMMAVMHETGHALYEQGLPHAWQGQPAGKAASMTIHESQSLLIEMQVARDPMFLDFAAPLMREAFGGAGPAWQAENLVRLAGWVGPGFIRVEADEVTYPLHVILRYRLEKALLDGDLDPADLPGAWNDSMAELLGIRPPDDRLGCLQDIHWAHGLFGYFPTYTLGALAAAQLFRAAREALPDLPAAIRRGDFAPLLTWLRSNVHEWGSLLTSEEIVERATGAPLGTAAFEAHLKERYGG
jgi:carboxypeptidase Taq